MQGGCPHPRGQPLAIAYQAQPGPLHHGGSDARPGRASQARLRDARSRRSGDYPRHLLTRDRGDAPRSGEHFGRATASLKWSERWSKSRRNCRFRIATESGAEEGTRTLTRLPSLAPQASVSTNSTTSARGPARTEVGARGSAILQAQGAAARNRRIPGLPSMRCSAEQLCEGWSCHTM